jgi:hypothetical protein
MTPILTDQSDTPLISAGLPSPQPCPSRYDNGRKFARICLRLFLTLAVVCALSSLGLLIYWLLIGVQQ